MENRKLRTLLIAAGVLALAALIWIFGKPRPAPAGPEREGESRIKTVRLSPGAMKEFGVVVEAAGPGTLETFLTLPGEVAANGDTLAHIVPRVSGVVKEVRKTLGDCVRKGEILATLESRELADLKAGLLAASERVALAQAVYTREEDLWRKKISSEQEYLQAKQAHAEALIEHRTAEQKLHALGFSEEDIKAVPRHPEAAFTVYELTAPFDGVVLEKHMTAGEAIPEDADVFTVADMGTVWVNLSVFQKDLPLLKEGQAARLNAGPGYPDVESRITYIGPLMGEQTRTALARIVLPNTLGTYRPGMFVNARIDAARNAVAVCIPRSALQTLEGRPHVFVLTAEGFTPRSVRTGREDGARVEILEGLSPGERYASAGTFLLKSELQKSALEGE